MTESPLAQSVQHLAERTHRFHDSDLDQPWRWRAHEEGARFALLGSYHELRDLAARLAHERAQQGPPVTLAQRVLAQVHLAYRELQALLLGVTDERYDQAPAPGEWPLRYVFGHVVAAERTFFALVHYGRARQHVGDHQPTEFPDGEVERVVDAREPFYAMMENGSLAEMRRYYAVHHQRVLDTFSDLTDDELRGVVRWWEQQDLDLQYRLHRFDAHLRQHTVQAEKTLDGIGQPPTEAKRLLRLVFRALAEVEAATLGAPELGRAEREALAASLRARADAVATRVAQARALVDAVRAGDAATLESLLAAEPPLAAAQDEAGVPALLLAVYHRQPALVERLVAARPELSIFEAAATGRLEDIQQAVEEWPGWVNEVARDGFTPLQLACYFGHAEVARWLLDHGADPSAVAANAQRITPLHAATANGSAEIVAALLARDEVDVNARQQGGGTPLHTAAANGDRALAQRLVARGADLGATMEDGRTPEAVARERGHDSLADWLAAQRDGG